MYRCVCQQDKTTTPDRNDLKLGAVVVLDSLSKSIDLEFKKSRLRVVACGSSIMPECSGCRRI